MEQNPLGCSSNDEGSDNSNSGSEDYYNNNEDHIEVDVEQAYSRRESNTLMAEEVDNMMLLRLMLQRCILGEQVRNL